MPSSRALESLCRENIAYRVLAGGVCPDHVTAVVRRGRLVRVGRSRWTVLADRINLRDVSDQPRHDGSFEPADNEPTPSAPRGPLFPDRAACSMCGSRGVIVLANPDNELDDLVAIGPLLLCEACATALHEGDDATLGTRFSDDWDFAAPAEMAAYLRARTAITVRAPVPSPDAVRLADQGFEPIGEFTGAHEVAHVWPEQHRAVLTRTGCRTEDDDGRTWLVRSPWPSLDLRETLNLVWSWIERDELARSDTHRQARAAEALAWGEQEALAWRQRMT